MMKRFLGGGEFDDGNRRDLLMATEYSAKTFESFLLAIVLIPIVIILVLVVLAMMSKLFG